jgi:hypothetical protein
MASANVGAAVNKRNGAISYFVANRPLKELRRLAMKQCREEAMRPSDCELVENRIGECSDPIGTGRRFGAFAGHHQPGGWKITMVCSTSFDQARDMLGKICKPCAMGDTFFDDSE